MNSGVFVLTDKDTLVSLGTAHFASEADFQHLLAKFPELLSGDQIDPASPRRWVLVRREKSVPSEDGGGGRWSLDHLFLDQDGVPTLVEVKRQTDTRIRREVVGQMLDYAANCVVYWPVEGLKADLEATCAEQGVSVDEALAELLGPEAEEAGFWLQVKTNLEAGRIRLLFVADAIPPELRRVIEFLNQQMDPAEVLGVELRQYEGHGLKTLVPLVVGQTQEATQKRNPAARTERKWDEEAIFAELKSRCSEAEVAVARALVDWMKSNGDRIWFGNGQVSGSMSAAFANKEAVEFWPVILYTYGRVEVQFQFIRSKPFFSDIENRRELVRRLTAIKGVAISEDALSKRPAVALATIAADPTGPAKLIDAFTWAVDQYRST